MNNQWQIYFLSIISFLIGTSQFIIVGVLDKIALSLHISIASAGQLVSVYALASAIGTPLLIVAMAKMNQRIQLIASMILFIAGIFSMLLFENYFFIILSRIIVGIGAGVFVVMAYGMSAALAKPGEKGQAMSNIAMGFSIALVFGVPLGRMITALLNWQAIFWFIGVLSVLCLSVLIKTLPKTVNEAPVSLRIQLAYLKQPKVVSSLMVTFLFFVSYTLIYAYITPFLTSIRILSENEMSVILMLLGVASFIGSKLAGVLSDRLETEKTLLGSIGVHFIMLLLLVVSHHSLNMSAMLLFIWITASWTFGPAQSINLASLIPSASGIMLSLNSSFVQLGFAIGAGIGGVAIAHASILALCGISLCFIGFSFYFMRLSFRYSLH